MINHVLIFLRSLNIWSFMYSFAFFTIYGYLTNSQYDQLPDILVPRAYDPSGLQQESRALGATILK